MPESSLATEHPHYVQVPDNTEPSDLPHYRRVITPREPRHWLRVLAALFGFTLMQALVALVAYGAY